MAASENVPAVALSAPLPAVMASNASSAPTDQSAPPPLEPEPEAEPAEPPSRVNLQSDPAVRRSLAWSVAPGNVFRFQAEVLEKLTDSAEAAENRRSYWFRWEVMDVNPDDVTTIAVLIERVSFSLKQPEIVFDSADGHSLYNRLVDPKAAEELVKAVALLDAQVVIEVNRQGDLVRRVGPEVGSTGCRFAPTDFPILPAVPVGPLDSWQERSRHATVQCTFRREQVSGDRTIAVVECDEPSPSVSDSGSIAMAHRTIARFDLAAGRYISRVTTGSNWEVRQQLLSSKSTAAFTKFRMHEPAPR